MRCVGSQHRPLTTIHPPLTSKKHAAVVTTHNDTYDRVITGSCLYVSSKSMGVRVCVGLPGEL